MKTQTIYREMPYPECKPEHNTEVICKFENDKFGTLFYWNDEEGFDAMTEPYHLMVVAWLKPEVVEEGKGVDFTGILIAHGFSWREDSVESKLLTECLKEAVRQDRVNRTKVKIYDDEYILNFAITSVSKPETETGKLQAKLVSAGARWIQDIIKAANPDIEFVTSKE